MSVAWSSTAWVMTSLTNRTTAASSSTSSSASCWASGADVALVAVLEGAGADAEVLDDELVHPLGHRQVPDAAAAG